jgi:hypothetical protein
MAEFDVKKFFGGFNLLNGEIRGKLYHQIIVVALLLWAAWFVLNRATGKTDATVITVQEGGIANISQVKEEKKRNWSVGAYLETRTQEFNDATYGLRLDYHL